MEIKYLGNVMKVIQKDKIKNEKMRDELDLQTNRE